MENGHANPNKGLKTSHDFIHQSKVVEMAGPLFCDVFFSERLLLNFGRIMPHVFSDRCDPSVALANKVALKKRPAIYPVRRVECKTFIISSGNPSLQKDNVFSGLAP